MHGNRGLRQEARGYVAAVPVDTAPQVEGKLNLRAGNCRGVEENAEETTGGVLPCTAGVTGTWHVTLALAKLPVKPVSWTEVIHSHTVW